MSLESKIEAIVSNKKFKKFLSRLYGFGASVVILGALFKIEHWRGASIMLSAGLLTESVIFFFYAFDSEAEPEHLEPSGVRAVGGGMHVQGTTPAIYGEGRPVFGVGYGGNYDGGLGGGLGGDFAGGQVESSGGSTLALARLDEMLQRADISPDLLMQFGSGLRKLGETVNNLESVGNVTEASQHYVNTIKYADESLDKLAKTYEETISKVTTKTVFKYKGIAQSMSIIETESRSYQQQMETLNKLLSTLNTVYSHQKREEDKYLRELVFSAVESKKYRKQVSELNEHLSTLNRYYGGMVKKLDRD